MVIIMTEPNNDSHNTTMDLTPITGSGSAPPDVVAYLSIRKQPPTHVFSDEVIEVDFSIEAVRGSSDSPPTNVSIQASLLGEDEEDLAGGGRGGADEPACMITVLEEPRVSASRRTGKLRCRVTSQQPRSCLIRLWTKENIVSEVLTRKMNIVSAKLRVTTDNNWTSTWYKDEGGRDKCMEVQVAVYDSHDQLVPDNSSLKLTLCYDEKSNYLTVTNQDLLRPMGKKLTQRLEGGKARVRFRIEDVSKNHQGQDFCVKIATTNPSIAPGYTPSVIVRSKRNKRQRFSTSSVASVDASLQQQPMLAHSGGGGVTQQSASVSSRPSYGVSDSSQPPFQHRFILEGPPSNEQDGLRGAIQGVVQWAEDVFNSLPPLHWQVLGYAPHNDGSPDFSRPYHSMPNPNEEISRILTQYSEQTRNQLRMLEDAVMRGSISSSSAAAASVSGGGVSGTAGAVVPQQQQHWGGMTASDSPFPGIHMHLHQDPYGTMMMHSGPMPPQPHRQPPFAAVGGGASMAMMHGQPLPQRMTSAIASQQPPSHMMEGTDALMYRDYSHPTDYYGRLLSQQQPQPPRHHRYDESSEPFPGAPAATSSKVSAHRLHHLTPAGPTALADEEEEEDEEDEEEEENQESNVEYVVATHFHNFRTKEYLGFPAFSARKILVGFYYKPSSTAEAPPGSSSTGKRHVFVPLRRDAVDHDEIAQQAGSVLLKAMDTNSEALIALKDWGSINGMLDQLTMYFFQKGTGDDADHGDSGGGGGGGGAAASVAAASSSSRDHRHRPHDP